MGIVVAAIFAVDVALYGYWGFRLDATPVLLPAIARRRHGQRTGRYIPASVRSFRDLCLRDILVV